MSPVSAASEFRGGVGTLLRGFGLFRRRPGLMLLGLLPAVIVAAALAAILVLYTANALAVATFLTPFLEPWDEVTRNLVRIGVAIALFLGIAAASLLGFTALTLLVGDPFYERIWRAVERELGEPDALEDPPFWRTVGDSAVLVLRAAGLGILTFAIGLVPVVGAPVAGVLGFWFSALGVAAELTARPLEARGWDGTARRRLLRAHRARVAGFGVAAFVLFLIPGGAIIGTPAAVAGATALARDLLRSGGARPQEASGRLAGVPDGTAP